MKTKCYSVKLKSLESITAKAYKAVAWDGSEAVIPKSQVYGFDLGSTKSDAYWISEWILKQKNLPYTTKKEAWLDENDRGYVSKKKVTVTTHVPDKVAPVENIIDELRR
jgi:hypothetical protein